MIRVVDFHPRYTEQLVPIAREIHAQSIYFDVPLDTDKLIEQLSGSGTRYVDRWFRIAVDEEEDLLCGALYGCVMRTFFGKPPVIKDMGQWTRRDGRARNAWALLLHEFEQWGRSLGAVKCSIGYHGMEDIEEKRRVFEFSGYRVTGYNTVKELHG